ncbi:hypothetical protein [Nonomuraea lactucae]|uniref:hypothetical protein n=1 Tax=Nonomuraea lactucae TaxID=2249762 RepID=UPI000DE4E027|nr:hypothetical protein [Nonomuraea lactucae]
MTSSGALRTALVRSSITSHHAVRSSSRCGSVHRPSRRTEPCRSLMVSSSAAGSAGVPANGSVSAPSLPGAATTPSTSLTVAAYIRATDRASASMFAAGNSAARQAQVV